MSSRELLALIEELPEKSKFREIYERTFRLVEHGGKLKLFPAVGRIPDDAVMVARYVDWTHEHKVQARMVQELAYLRVVNGDKLEPDMTGLLAPLEEILRRRAAERKANQLATVKSTIRAGLYARVPKGGD
jgi:hypothetical protein